jgi:hypothetical protein
MGIVVKNNWMLLPTKEEKERRDKYFEIIRALRHEYMEVHKGILDITVRPRLDFWANEKYGFQMETDGQGNYTADYTVTDPKKFMLFQIKYWQ